MSKSKFLFSVKALILLSPLPFASATRIWSPIFYLAVLVISGMALTGINDRIDFLYQRKVRVLFSLFVFYLLFQLIPLPRFLLNILSPFTVETLDGLSLKPILFHSLSLVPAETLMFGMQFMVMALFFWILMHQDLTKQDMYSLVDVMALSVFFQLGLGSIKWLLRSQQFFLFFYKTGNTSRIMNGTFLRPDHLAFYLQMAFPLVLGMVLIKIYILRPIDSPGVDWLRFFLGDWKLIFYSLVLLGAAGGIVLTKSMSGQMALFLTVCLMAVGFVYFRMVRGPVSHQTMRWLVLAIVVLVVIFAVYNTMGAVHYTDRGGNIRAEFWKDTMNVISHFPLFGVGYGNFKNISYQCRTQRDESMLVHPYNEILEHLVDGGILGTGLFLTFLVFLLVSMFRMWFARRHPEIRFMGLAALVSLFVAGFHEIFDYALRTPANALFFVLIMALGFKLVLYKRGKYYEK